MSEGPTAAAAAAAALAASAFAFVADSERLIYIRPEIQGDPMAVAGLPDSDQTKLAVITKQWKKNK